MTHDTAEYTALIGALARHLKPRGFRRKDSCWNRGCDEVEVIDVQIGKSGDTVTLNAGVLDREIHKAVWDSGADEFISVPICTVSTRIGALNANLDIWWSLGDPELSAICIRMVDRWIMPFLDRCRSREGMEKWLEIQGHTIPGYPFPILNLAIIKDRLGKRGEAIDLLGSLDLSKAGAWRPRIERIVRSVNEPERP